MSRLLKMVSQGLSGMSLGKVGYSFSSAPIEMIKSGLSQPAKETVEKPETIVSFTVSRENVEIPEMDWAKFDAITDEEIDQAMADDPDAYEPTEDEWKQGVKVC